MLKKLVDTNILIDRFSNPSLHKEIFQNKKDFQAIKDIFDFKVAFV